MRLPTGIKRLTPYHLGPLKHSVILDLFSQNKSTKEIAKIVRTSVVSVNRVLRIYGVKRNRAQFIDESGLRYGEVTVLGFSGTIRERSGARAAVFMCACDCGKLFQARGYQLRIGRTVSCGHKRKQNFKKS